MSEMASLTDGLGSKSLPGKVLQGSKAEAKPERSVYLFLFFNCFLRQCVVFFFVCFVFKRQGFFASPGCHGSSFFSPETPMRWGGRLKSKGGSSMEGGDVRWGWG